MSFLGSFLGSCSGPIGESSCAAPFEAAIGGADLLASAAWTLAYLDPGSGAMLVQMLLAGVAGVFLFFKYQGRRLLGLLGLRRKDQGPGSPPGPGTRDR